jgi:mRNA interferase MazF
LVAARQAAAGKRKPWVPDRQDIIWIDCNLQVGREMRDVHPFDVTTSHSTRLSKDDSQLAGYLVLSPRIFNEKTSLVIGLPMTTAECNADNPFAVAVGKTSGRKIGQTSYVLCHQPKSFDWRLRKAKTHPLGTLTNALFAQVCERLNQIIQVG